MMRCVQRVLVALCLLCLPTDLAATCHIWDLPAGYFVGSVGAAYLASKNEILSAGDVEYYYPGGDQNLSDPFEWSHSISNQTAGGVALLKWGTSISVYSKTQRVGAIAENCYRALLAVSERCASNHWGSSQVCAPKQEDPGTGIPETQPGDGTGGEPDPRPSTPIVIDLEGDGFRFTSYARGTSFDLNADGVWGWTAWTDPDGNEAFLALDRNANGAIDSGAELFGDHTLQPASPSPNGFAALAVYDQPAQGGNGDGLLSATDLIFPSLLLWRDSNHDGVSQPTEIKPLSWSQIRAIDLDYILSRRRDQHGNQLRWASRIQFARGWKLGAADVIFAAE